VAYFERIESDIKFKYPKNWVWDCENSELYKRSSEQNKIAEFVFFEPSIDSELNTEATDQYRESLCRIWFIEVKKSIPRSNADFLQEVRSKLMNAASLFLALRLGFHEKSTDELPEALRSATLKPSNAQFVLIVPECPKDQLPPLCEALVKVMLPTLKIWGMSSLQVKVFNADIAQSKQWLAPKNAL
jgi:hypothetical protein